MRRLILGLLLMAVACGQPQAQPPTSPAVAATPSFTANVDPSPSPSLTASPTPSPRPSQKSSPLPTPRISPSLLFAALEAKGTPAGQWNTVAIAGLDGYARAKTTFVPMPVPNVGCLGAFIPISARVVAGNVYFADGTGVVRSLSANGRITKVTTFPLVSRQQMLSFAVSPDGGRLLGTIFTLPAKPNLGCGGTSVVTGYSLDVYSAKPGSTSTLLYHVSLPTLDMNARSFGINVMALAGWDQVGPIATYPTGFAAEGGLPQNFYGTPVRLDANTGKVLKQVSPGSCYVQDIALSGDFACSLGANGDLSVRRPSGSEIWRAVSQPKNNFFMAFLSPDEHRLAAAHTSGNGTDVVGQNGSRVVVTIWPVGWLDSTTLIGANDALNLSYVALNAPKTIVSMGFQGKFLGTVHR